MSLENLNIVSELLQRYYSKIIFEENLFVAIEEIPSIQRFCNENKIEEEKVGNKLRLKLRSFVSMNLIYYDLLTTTFESNYINEEFAILNITGEYCYRRINTDLLVFSESASENFQLICSNVYNYYRLYNFFKSENFADHHNDANNEIVIYSSARGILRIKYHPVPEIDSSKNISYSVEQIVETCSQIQLRPFFKNALFDFANGTRKIYIHEIMSKAKDIISVTKRDYELVSKQFDFEKFKDSLYKEKEKYFSNIREIINKIFSQAIGIPISITATVFATYKVSDDIFILLIVLIAFVVYIVFYIRLQFVYKSDIIELKKDFINDFEIIKTKSGLPEVTVQIEKTKIERKINSTVTTIHWLISAIVCLGLLVIWYVIYGIIKSDMFCFWNH